MAGKPQSNMVLAASLVNVISMRTLLSPQILETVGHRYREGGIRLRCLRSRWGHLFWIRIGIRRTVEGWGKYTVAVPVQAGTQPTRKLRLAGVSLAAHGIEGVRGDGGQYRIGVRAAEEARAIGTAYEGGRSAHSLSPAVPLAIVPSTLVRKS